MLTPIAGRSSSPGDALLLVLLFYRCSLLAVHRSGSGRALLQPHAFNAPMPSKQQHLSPAIRPLPLRPLPPVAPTLAGLEMFAEVASVHRFFSTGDDRDLYLADLARRRQMPRNTARPHRRAIRRPPVLPCPSSPDSDGTSPPPSSFLLTPPLPASSCPVSTEMYTPPNAVALTMPTAFPALHEPCSLATALNDPRLCSRPEQSPPPRPV
jgi:hypothetical protein